MSGTVQDHVEDAPIRRCQTFEDALDEAISRCREIMLDRQRKYGPKNISGTGKAGIVVRLSDKIARISHKYWGAQTRPQEFDDESEEDTWADIANYGLIGLMVHLHIWGLPLEEELAAPE